MVLREYTIISLGEESLYHSIKWNPIKLINSTVIKDIGTIVVSLKVPQSVAWPR